MKITIKYCGIWEYKPKAQVVSNEILKSYPDVEVILEESDGGRFDVIYEDDPPGLLFSKDEHNRFPEDGEIIKLIGINE